MPAWSFVGSASPLALAGNPDGGEKVPAFANLAPAADRPGGILPQVGQQGQIGVPPGGSAAWWRDFVQYARQEFVRRAKMQSPNISTVGVSANNGPGGDVAGIGVLTITVSTS